MSDRVSGPMFGIQGRASSTTSQDSVQRRSASAHHHGRAVDLGMPVPAVPGRPRRTLPGLLLRQAQLSSHRLAQPAGALPGGGSLRCSFLRSKRADGRAAGHAWGVQGGAVSSKYVQQWAGRALLPHTARLCKCRRMRWAHHTVRWCRSLVHPDRPPPTAPAQTRRPGPAAPAGRCWATRPAGEGRRQCGVGVGRHSAAQGTGPSGRPCQATGLQPRQAGARCGCMVGCIT